MAVGPVRDLQLLCEDTIYTAGKGRKKTNISRSKDKEKKRDALSNPERFSIPSATGGREKKRSRSPYSQMTHEGGKKKGNRKPPLTFKRKRTSEDEFTADPPIDCAAKTRGGTRSFQRGEEKKEKEQEFSFERKEKEKKLFSTHLLDHRTRLGRRRGRTSYL